MSNILLEVIELYEVVLAWLNPTQPTEISKIRPKPNPTHGWTQPTSISGYDIAYDTYNNAWSRPTANPIVVSWSTPYCVIIQDGGQEPEAATQS